jgi:hypothetical protein
MPAPNTSGRTQLLATCRKGFESRLNPRSLRGQSAGLGSAEPGPWKGERARLGRRSTRPRVKPRLPPRDAADPLVGPPAGMWHARRVPPAAGRQCSPLQIHRSGSAIRKTCNKLKCSQATPIPADGGAMKFETRSLRMPASRPRTSPRPKDGHRQPLPARRAAAGCPISSPRPRRQRRASSVQGMSGLWQIGRGCPLHPFRIFH